MKLDLTDERFGRLTVLAEAESVSGHRRWECRCDCGGTTVVRQGRLRSGETQSCGCLMQAQRKWFGKHRWTGDEATYPAMHSRVTRAHGQARLYGCIDCGTVSATNEWSYIRGCSEERLGGQEDGRTEPLPYCLHLEHYTPRCQDCHGKLDSAPLGSARRLRTILLGTM